jgi:hypothetical protein
MRRETRKPNRPDRRLPRLVEGAARGRSGLAAVVCALSAHAALYRTVLPADRDRRLARAARWSAAVAAPAALISVTAFTTADSLAGAGRWLEVGAAGLLALAATILVVIFSLPYLAARLMTGIAVVAGLGAGALGALADEGRPTAGRRPSRHTIQLFEKGSS